MRPRFLDGKGLVACWRETLLAQAVLAGRTRGYTHHPQLIRFRREDDPSGLIGAYLAALAEEATCRGYHFDRSRIDRDEARSGILSVTEGQLDHEWQHLGAKLERRSPEDARHWRESSPEPHPLFRVVPGPIESWERPSPNTGSGA